MTKKREKRMQHYLLVWMDGEEKAKLKKLASTNHMSMAAYMRLLLREAK